MGALKSLAGGGLGLIIAAGLGSVLTRLLGPISSRWRLASSLVAGVAVVNLCVMVILFLGGGVTGLKVAGMALAAIGCGGLLASRKYLSFFPGPQNGPRPARWFIAVVVAALTVNLVIALAPSTKIDELYYHMLIPKRVIEDGGLHQYRMPFEAAIVPQTGFQLGLSVAHAAGFPEAGNVISWGLGAMLVLLVAGVTADLTGSATAGWATGAISAVGLYPSVWHVTSGPHALGDLATVTACLLALLPERFGQEMTPTTRLALVCLAACAVASTKISILPLALAITLIAVHRVAGSITWRKAAAIALGVWVVFYAPAVVWTTLESGSPFGPVTASLFHSQFFGSEPIAQMALARSSRQTGWIPLLSWLAPSVSAGLVVAFAVLVAGVLKGEPGFKILLGLVCGQAILILWLLPQEFRFLGGLQYAVLVMGAWVAWRSRIGTRLLARWWIVLAGLCLPWLFVQIYYARPFIRSVSGAMSRDAFLRQYVAFEEDFGALDHILPADAVIYVANFRLPAYYAPRPVVFALQDLRGRRDVYRFRVGEAPPSPSGSLSCTETVYANSRAVSIVFRSPGRAAVLAPLTVERCDVVPGDRPGG